MKNVGFFLQFFKILSKFSDFLSHQNGGPFKDPLKLINTIECCDLRGFMGPSNAPPPPWFHEMLVSRTALQLFAVVFSRLKIWWPKKNYYITIYIYNRQHIIIYIIKYFLKTTAYLCFKYATSIEWEWAYCIIYFQKFTQQYVNFVS